MVYDQMEPLWCICSFEWTRWQTKMHSSHMLLNWTALNKNTEMCNTPSRRPWRSSCTSWIHDRQVDLTHCWESLWIVCLPFVGSKREGGIERGEFLKNRSFRWLCLLDCGPQVIHDRGFCTKNCSTRRHQQGPMTRKLITMDWTRKSQHSVDPLLWNFDILSLPPFFHFLLLDTRKGKWLSYVGRKTKQNTPFVKQICLLANRLIWQRNTPLLTAHQTSFGWQQLYAPRCWCSASFVYHSKPRILFVVSRKGAAPRRSFRTRNRRIVHSRMSLPS